MPKSHSERENDTSITKNRPYKCQKKKKYQSMLISHHITNKQFSRVRISLPVNHVETIMLFSSWTSKMALQPCLVFYWDKNKIITKLYGKIILPICQDYVFMCAYTTQFTEPMSFSSSHFSLSYQSGFIFANKSIIIH